MATSSSSKPNNAEYFATSIKKVIVLSFLTLGWYNLRWFITNFHRFVLAKTSLKTPFWRAVLTVIMYFGSIFTLILLTYDIKRQAKEHQIKTWWHPLTLYALFITAGIITLPYSFESMTFGYQLSAMTYFTFYVMSISLVAFIMSTLQHTINLINAERTMKFVPTNRFSAVHILAFVLAPFLWFFIASSCYYRSLPPENVAYLAIQRGNYQQALNILRPISNQGDAKASLLLGQMYNKGWGVTKDTAKANEYYDAASKSNDPKLLTVVATHYLSQAGSVLKAIQLLKRAATQNFLPAINQLSLIYSTNQYVHSDYNQAFEYAEQSAKQANPTGEFLLSMLYRNPPNNQPNWTEYAKYLKKSAEQGYPPAAYYLGIGYRDGNKALKKDSQAAVKWFQIAAKGKYPPAQTELANAYNTGVGIKQNKKQAVKLFQQSAQQGDDIAQYNLAHAYATGQGIAQNEKLALNWYNKAAQKNNSCAVNDLGIMYSEGRGVAADDASAASYFKQAAKDGFRATNDEFKSLRKPDDLVTLERSRTVGLHRISPEQYQNAYTTYMLSLYSQNKADYMDKLSSLSPLALKEAKYLRQYYKLACWQ